MTDEVSEIFSFGTWVRRRRKALDLTQAALADRVGCAAVSIRKLEADAFRPSREVAKRLAECLNIPSNERMSFLQAARGEHSVDRLPTPTTPIQPIPQSITRLSRPSVPILLNHIPDPVPLPPGSRMPLGRNPLFVGRDANLRQLVDLLHAGGTAAIGQVDIAAATGLGEIGKTRLACEFVHRYGQFFPDGVFWLSFADAAAIPAEVAACGGTDGLQLRPDFGTLPLDEQIKLVLTAWESATVRLLIFNNCEDAGLLDQWRPKHGGCRMLITSRRHHWDAVLGVQSVPLDVLPRAESIGLLRQFRPDLPADDADLAAIADALGDLPLALHLAGSFLAHYRQALTPAQYLKRLPAATILNDRSLQAAGLSPTQHVQHVARTFEQSYQRLDPADLTDTLARTLLAHATCFAPGEPCMHVQRLSTRRKPLGCRELLLDSRAWGELRHYGHYRATPQHFTDHVHRIADVALVDRLVPVTQDYMCEAAILRKTGLTVAQHQRLTIERSADRIVTLDPSLPLMPVLQGALPEQYADHLRQYGDRLHFGMWIGVGSVCKRNGHPREIAAVLRAIQAERPDLRLHVTTQQMDRSHSKFCHSVAHHGPDPAGLFRRAWVRTRGEGPPVPLCRPHNQINHHL